MKYFYPLCLVFIVFGIYLFSYHLFYGDLLFHTDIARDFLLIQDIVTNHKLTLIGPRAGGIPGTFFGPIWLYLNLPAYLIGNGNPVVVGYFWVVLMIFALACTFYVTKQIFNTTTAFVATTLFIYVMLYLAPGFTQSFGAIIFSPLVLYAMNLFIEKKKLRYLSYAAFFNGMLIQFQPAFGLLLLLISIIISLRPLIQSKKSKYIFLWFISLIPLSTYVFFELRHGFIETHALINFLFHSEQHSLSIRELLVNRLQGFLDTLNILSNNNFLFNLFFVVLNGIIVYKWYKSKKSSSRTFVLLVYLYIVGYWLTTFLFKGTVWTYYYWGFNPLLCITIASLYYFLEKRLFIILTICMLLYLAVSGFIDIRNWQTQFSGKDTSSWLLNLQIANYIYHDAQEDFGYYIFSNDRFGYAKRYAMFYTGRAGNYPEKGTLCTKKHLTYLIFNKTFKNSYTDPVYWKKVRVNINTQPVSVKMIQGLKIEKYFFTVQQIQMPSQPSLICGLEWR